MLVDCVLVLRFIDGKNWDTWKLKELFFLKCLENSLGFNNCSVKVKVLVSHIWLFEIPWTSFLCPQNSLGENSGVGSHSVLQGIFPTQGLNLGLLTAGKFLPSELPGKPKLSAI